MNLGTDLYNDNHFFNPLRYELEKNIHTVYSWKEQRTMYRIWNKYSVIIDSWTRLTFGYTQKIPKETLTLKQKEKNR